MCTDQARTLTLLLETLSNLVTLKCRATPVRLERSNVISGRGHAPWPSYGDGGLRVWDTHRTEPWGSSPNRGEYCLRITWPCDQVAGNISLDDM